jgi:hypothetical protein
MSIKDTRLYTFVNFYLSSIQQGIQSAHVGTELSSKYRGKRNGAVKLLRQWEDHDKTMIVLNGGMAVDIRDGFESALSYEADRVYPYAAFYEEPGAIHESKRAITAWGIVLPPEVYLAKPVEAFPSRRGFSTLSAEEITPETKIFAPGSFEFFICSHMQSKGLAR